MKKNERLQALFVLKNVLENKTPLSHSLVSTPLSPLSKELCFGVCRHYFRLAAIADCLLTKRPKVIEIWISVLIGLYQLHYLRIPDYAVVKETVALLEQLKKNWAKGLVNAVLRRFCREQTVILSTLESNSDFLYNHPAWFIKRLQATWPTDWQAILEANDKHPPMSLRANKQHVSAQDYHYRLNQLGIEATRHSFSAQGLTLTAPCDVHDLPGFSTGEVSVQDEAAQLAASLLNLTPGLHVLDACAAPGGKTCHLLETEPALASCVALDIDSARLARVQDNLTRLQLKATLLKGDAAHPEQWWDGQLFDRILLDAPCSATGVIRRHPDIKLLREEKDITTVVKLQATLLQALWPLLRPGGLMLYATCSIMSEENEQQIARFINTHPDCENILQPVSWGRSTGHGWQILPGRHNMDGFFYSVLKKCSSARHPSN